MILFFYYIIYILTYLVLFSFNVQVMLLKNQTHFLRFLNKESVKYLLTGMAGEVDIFTKKIIDLDKNKVYVQTLMVFIRTHFSLIYCLNLCFKMLFLPILKKMLFFLIIQFWFTLPHAELFFLALVKDLSFTRFGSHWSKVLWGNKHVTFVETLITVKDLPS